MTAALPIDEGLLGRFRAAGIKVQWRDAPKAAAGRRSARPARIAHLHDEEARVERSESTASTTVVVDSGPLGALVLLLEIDRRGAPASLSPAAAGERRGFDQGAIVAQWGAVRGPAAAALPISDLVELARYALA